jgi:hypothetical protein
MTYLYGDLSLEDGVQKTLQFVQADVPRQLGLYHVFGHNKYNEKPSRKQVPFSCFDLQVMGWALFLCETVDRSKFLNPALSQPQETFYELSSTSRAM